MDLHGTPRNANKNSFHPPERADQSDAFYDSSALFGNRRQIAINHNGTIYRLKITRYGKLILNK